MYSTMALADIQNDIVDLRWSIGMTSAVGGVYDYISPPATCHIELDNSSGIYTPGANQDLGPFLFDGLIEIELSTSNVSDVQMYVGRVEKCYARDNDGGARPTVILECEGIMNTLLDAPYRPPLLLDKRVDEIIKQPFDDAAVAWPYAQPYWVVGVSETGIDTTVYENTLTDFEQSLTTLAYAGDISHSGREERVQTFMRDALRATAGGRLWFGRSGKLQFQNRYHSSAATSVFTLSNGDIDATSPPQRVYGNDVVTDVSVVYQPRSVGSPGSTLFSSESVPFKIVRGSEQTKTAQYTDPANADADVSALDANAPTIVANTAEDGTGNNIAIQTRVQTTGTASIVTFINNTNVDLWITSFSVTGTPLRTYAQETARHVDENALVRYGQRPLIIDIAAISDSGYADGVARRHVARFSQPLSRYEFVTWRPSTLAKASALLATDIGDVITVSDDAYTLVGEQILYDINTRVPVITWYLKPLQRERVWVIGSLEYGIIGTTTIAGL